MTVYYIVGAPLQHLKNGLAGVSVVKKKNYSIKELFNALAQQQQIECYRELNDALAVANASAFNSSDTTIPSTASTRAPIFTVELQQNLLIDNKVKPSDIQKKDIKQVAIYETDNTPLYSQRFQPSFLIGLFTDPSVVKISAAILLLAAIAAFTVATCGVVGVIALSVTVTAALYATTAVCSAGAAARLFCSRHPSNGDTRTIDTYTMSENLARTTSPF